jgi:hypothetical protein
MEKIKCGKSFFSLTTQSYFRGGIYLFWAGVSPFNIAFLACTMKWSTGPFSDTFFTNS